MTGIITAAAIGTVGAVGGAALSANAASKQQKRGFNRQDQGIGELVNLRDQQRNDPRLALLNQLVQNRLLNPNALDPRTVELMKAQGAADATRATQGALDSIRSRAAATGSGRSGNALGAQGRVAQSLGGTIANLNRGIDIEAARSQQQGEIQAMQMLAQLLGLEQQPTRDIANAYQGQGAQIAQTPNPWAGFFQQAAGGFGSATANAFGQINAQNQQAQQQANFDQLMQLYQQSQSGLNDTAYQASIGAG